MKFIKENKKYIAGLLALVLFIFVGNQVYASIPKTVELNIDTEVTELETTAKTVEELLVEQGFNLDKIQVDKDLTDKITRDSLIVVNTEKNVQFRNQGRLQNVTTYLNTVSSFLRENGIDVDKDDLVSPDANSRLVDNMTVQYDKVEVESYKVNEDVAFEQVEEFSFDLPYGEKLVETEGEDGIRTTYMAKTKINDRVVSDLVDYVDYEKEPVTQVTLVGTREEVERTVEYDTERRENSSMYKDQTNTIQEGENGLVVEVYENKGEDDRQLVSSETVKEPVTRILEVGTKSRPVSRGPSSSSASYSLSQFKFHGVVNWGGFKFTYYSQSVLPGGGLRIPGRHVNSNGYVADENGYIVLASSYSVPMGTVINTPFGGPGKVYDRCGNCSVNWYDVYIK